MSKYMNHAQFESFIAALPEVNPAATLWRYRKAEQRLAELKVEQARCIEEMMNEVNDIEARLSRFWSEQEIAVAFARSL